MSLSAPRVYAIADWHALGDLPLSEGVRRMVRAGVPWIQIRAKGVPGATLEQEVERVFAAEWSRKVALWIDDRADLAAVYPFAGVHVGQQDLPPAAARIAAGGRPWIGLSTHNLEQLVGAERDPDVDVIALGPIFPTSGKEHPDPVVGLELLGRARALCSKPLVAIGGITAERVPTVLAAGADTVVVLGAASRGDIEGSCRLLLEAAS